MLKATPARWWVTHKQFVSEWTQCRRLLEIRFGEHMTYNDRKYTGLKDPIEHIEYCSETWKAYPQPEWVHHFIHTLDMIPRNWYTSIDMR